MESKALNSNEGSFGDYEPGTELITESDRLKSARKDIDELSRMIRAVVPTNQGGNAATKIRGIPVSKEELEAFMKYLTDHKVESYTKADVENFLNAYSSGNLR